MAKILFITSRFPYPLNKGDKLRAYFQLKYLAKENEVHLVAINEANISDKDLDCLSPFCKSIHPFILPLHKRIFQLFLSPFRRIPLQVAFFYDNGIKKKIERITEEIKPDLIHCHLIRTTEYVKDISKIRKSLDFMDAFAKGMEKRQKIEPNIFKRIIFIYEKTNFITMRRKSFIS